MKAALNNEKLKSVYNHVAKRYDFQHTFLTAHSDDRGRKLLVQKSVKPGDKVLDCGAGTGSTGLMAAQVVGSEDKVTLFDLSEGMLDVAKEKAREKGLLQKLKFHTGDILKLPFEDNSFDVVLSTYSLCPVYDPAKGALEMLRVTKPGGLLGVAHSTEPEAKLVKWFADKVENIVWYFPSLSLGCRSVSVLTALEEAGCKVIFKKRIGVPLWPFMVFVVVKPYN
jgi:demethylmenaquinone methyltransferase / 2-methoxy-6-polyprenyl-1,4-benzoquinol methylase